MLHTSPDSTIQTFRFIKEGLYEFVVGSATGIPISISSLNWNVLELLAVSSSSSVPKGVGCDMTY